MASAAWVVQSAMSSHEVGDEGLGSVPGRRGTYPSATRCSTVQPRNATTATTRAPVASGPATTATGGRGWTPVATVSSRTSRTVPARSPQARRTDPRDRLGRPDGPTTTWRSRTGSVTSPTSPRSRGGATEGAPRVEEPARGFPAPGPTASGGRGGAGPPARAAHPGGGGTRGPPAARATPRARGRP